MSDPIAPFLADETYFVGLLMGTPHFSEDIKPNYLIHVRSLTPDWDAAESTAPEIMLTSGERHQVRVIGTATLLPTPEAMENGEWSGSDGYLLLDATMVSLDVMEQARWFVQQRIGPLPSYDEPPA